MRLKFSVDCPPSSMVDREMRFSVFITTSLYYKICNVRFFISMTQCKKVVYPFSQNVRKNLYLLK